MMTSLDEIAFVPSTDMPGFTSGARVCTGPQAFGGFNFITYVDGSPRTFGCVIRRLARSSCDLYGLDLALLTDLAIGRANTAAWGKIAIIGNDGFAVFQITPGAAPALVWCGHATSAMAFLTGEKKGLAFLHGPGARKICVSFSTIGNIVSQTWTLQAPVCIEQRWRDRTVLRCTALNDYAVVLDSLPDNVSPQQARQELAGSGLEAKLAVVTRPSVGHATVRFYNSSGLHGAAPMTGLATLAILARFSTSISNLLFEEMISFYTKYGPRFAPLPEVTESKDLITVKMPTADVMLYPFGARRTQ